MNLILNIAKSSLERKTEIILYIGKLFDVVLEGILHKKDCPYPYVSCYCRITAALTLNQVTVV